MNVTQRRNEVRTIAGPSQLNERLVVIPNDAPAYARSGPWGIYDTEYCNWVNFRETETAARKLRDFLNTRPDLWQ